MTQEPVSAGIERIWDRHLKTDVLRLMPGAFIVTQDDVVLTTVLGSCISACVRDTERGIGGMNHFMLPDIQHEAPVDSATAARYGTHAMRMLIDEIVRLGGCLERLEVKIFGGGRIVDGMTDVGDRNIRFIREFLDKTGICTAAEDLGLTYPRKINYFVQSGRVMVKKLRALHNRAVAADERKYCNDVAMPPGSSS